MANTDITTREGYERSTLSGSSERIRRGSERGAAVYSVIAGLIGAGLCVVAVAMIESWAQWVVLGVIVVFTYGLARWIWPERVNI